MKLIVEMEKVPKNCDDGCWGYLSGECPWADHVDGYTMNGGRPRNCPIKGVLPEEHGDLVDVDTVLWEVLDNQGIETAMPVTVGDVLEGYDVPIVIAAERKDDGTTAD